MAAPPVPTVATPVVRNFLAKIIHALGRTGDSNHDMRYGSRQKHTPAQLSMLTNHGGATVHNYETRMQYSQQRPQPNQYGAYGQGMTQDIGTTRSEQMMSGMGGLSHVMQADRNTGYYGPSQGPNQYQQQYGYSGGQGYGGGGPSYGMQQSYPQPSQYGTYSPGMSQGIGTTQTEQMMQSGMGGLSHVMQADRNTGYYGPSQSQQQYGYSGSQGGYGGGGPSYGMQQSYPQPSQYGTYSPGMSQGIGTTQTEQTMQSGMGGLSHVMQADRNTGYYGGPSHPMQQYGQGSSQSYGMGGNFGNYGMQYGYQQPSQYGTYSPGMSQGIGSTQTEQAMQSGMDGMSQVMQADRNTGYYGPSQPQQQMGQYGGQGTMQSYSGGYNPGDTQIERQAKQNLGVSTTQTPSDEF